MRTLELSTSFINLVREVTKKDKNAKPICDFCFNQVEEVQKYLPDPMVGKVCTSCQKELDAHHKDDETAAPKRKQFVSTHAVGTPARVKEAGVIGAVHDLIFVSERISIAKLKGEMEDKGYKPGTVNAQLARVKKAYIVKDDIIYADEKALNTMEEKRK